MFAKLLHIDTLQIISPYFKYLVAELQICHRNYLDITALTVMQYTEYVKVSIAIYVEQTVMVRIYQYTFNFLPG